MWKIGDCIVRRYNDTDSLGYKLSLSSVIYGY